MGKRINITLAHSVTSWEHRVNEIQGDLIYQSDEVNVYYLKTCKCAKAKPETLAYQACIAVQAIGLHAGRLVGVK